MRRAFGRRISHRIGRPKVRPRPRFQVRIQTGFHSHCQARRQACGFCREARKASGFSFNGPGEPRRPRENRAGVRRVNARARELLEIRRNGRLRRFGRRARRINHADEARGFPRINDEKRHRRKGFDKRRTFRRPRAVHFPGQREKADPCGQDRRRSHGPGAADVEEPVERRPEALRNASCIRLFVRTARGRRFTFSSCFSNFFFSFFSVFLGFDDAFVYAFVFFRRACVRDFRRFICVLQGLLLFCFL